MGYRPLNTNERNPVKDCTRQSRSCEPLNLNDIGTFHLLRHSLTRHGLVAQRDTSQFKHSSGLRRSSHSRGLPSSKSGIRIGKGAASRKPKRDVAHELEPGNRTGLSR